mmetsp:Transcript_31186/g.48251  ORF Transcript_31186/g.48251 Transcript_31186/m.48251 type:complete len:120 (+) Transcript_31186:449-808(+)
MTQYKEELEQPFLFKYVDLTSFMKFIYSRRVYRILSEDDNGPFITSSNRMNWIFYLIYKYHDPPLDGEENLVKVKIMLWNDGGELYGFGSSLSVQRQGIDITDPTVYHKLLSTAWRWHS